MSRYAAGCRPEIGREQAGLSNDVDGEVLIGGSALPVHRVVRIDMPVVPRLNVEGGIDMPVVPRLNVEGGIDLPVVSRLNVVDGTDLPRRPETQRQRRDRHASSS